MKEVGSGIPGYATPKVAVGAAVVNDEGELLLIQRADSGIWLYPTGWCDVGYSARSRGEGGPGGDRHRGRARAPHWSPRRNAPRSLACPALLAALLLPRHGGSLNIHPLECTDAGWFTRDNLPSPVLGAERWAGPIFAAIDGRAPRRLLRRSPPSRLARRAVSVTVETARHASDELLAGLNRLLPQLSSSAPPLTMVTLRCSSVRRR